MNKAIFLFAAAVVTACSRTDSTPPAPKEVEVTADDYAFTAPETVPAGRTTFRFSNRGKVAHELNISRLKKGVTIQNLLDSVRADLSVKSLIEGPVGVLFATPASKSQAGLTVDLAPGEQYAVICIFTDSTGGKPHYDLGMYKAFSVTGGNASAVRASAVDTIVATDYAFRYPREVKPGLHTFVMRNEGKQRHEFSVVMLKKGVTLERVREVEKAKGNVEALFDGQFGLLHARSGVTPLGGLTIDMQPGREYVIACFFQDDEKSPPHYDLGMFGAIKVAES